MIYLNNKTLKGDVFPPGGAQRDFVKATSRIQVIDMSGGAEDDASTYFIDWDMERDPEEITPLEWEQRALQKRIDAFKRLERPDFEVDALIYQSDRLKRLDFAGKLIGESTIKAGPLTLADGSKVMIDASNAKSIVKFLKSVGNDAKRFENELLSSKKKFDEVLSFIAAKEE